MKTLKTWLETHIGRGEAIRVNFYGVLLISTMFIEKSFILGILKYIHQTNSNPNNCFQAAEIIIQ